MLKCDLLEGVHATRKLSGMATNKDVPPYAHLHTAALSSPAVKGFVAMSSSQA